MPRPPALIVWSLILFSVACPAGSGQESAEKSAPANPGDPLAALATAVAAAPDDTEVRRKLARALYEAGRVEEALEHFVELSRRDPSVTSFLDLGLTYGSNSRLSEADAAYGKLLEIAPEHPVGLHNLGNIAQKRGDVERAVELYQRALRVNPRYLLAYYHLAEALRQNGNFRPAYVTYEKVLELEPGNPKELNAYFDALYRMASLDITMGAHERAVQLLSELLQAYPEHPNAHYAYGQALLQLGRTEEAQRAFAAHVDLLAEQEPTGPAATGE